MSRDSMNISRRDVLVGVAGAAASCGFGTLFATPANAKAPMLGKSLPTHYRVKLGGFEVTTVHDGAVGVPKVFPIFGNNKSKDDVAAQMTANMLPADKMAIPFTPVVVNTGRELVIFDSGNGARRRGVGAGLLAERLALAGYKPEDFDVVVLTHFHPDHIGGLMEGGKPLFANARYVTSEVEYNFWAKPALAESSNAGMAARGKLVQANVVPFSEKMSFVKPNADVVTGITAVKAFGHTPGHMAYHIESNGQRLLLWADTTNHYVASLQRPDWHVIFDMDKAEAVATRKRILDMVSQEKIPATGYHMPFPAVGFVEKKGTGYRWVPASYQLEL